MFSFHITLNESSVLISDGVLNAQLHGIKVIKTSPRVSSYLYGKFFVLYTAKMCS